MVYTVAISVADYAVHCSDSAIAMLLSVVSLCTGLKIAAPVKLAVGIIVRLHKFHNTAFMKGG